MCPDLMRVPKGKRIMKKQNELTKFYHRREINLLAEYLGRRDDLPASLYDPDTLTPVDEDWDESTQGIGIHEGSNAGSKEAEEYALANAVARICLASVQDNLPQWAAVKDGEVTLARNVRDSSELPERILVPRHLFTLNWANSAPGISWPEAYYVTQLPGWDVHIVTASQDSDEIYGYEDFAIGWLDAKQDAVEGAKDVLIRYWRSLQSEYDQKRWEELYEFSQGEPDAWGDQVWPPEDADGEVPRKTRGISCGPDHPIYSEGWTIGPIVVLSRQTEQD